MFETIGHSLKNLGTS